jgi:hypothetical protein
MTVPRKPRAASKPAAKPVAAKPAAAPSVARRSKPLGQEFTHDGDFVDLAIELRTIRELVDFEIVNNDDGTHTLVATPAAAEA